MKPVFQTKFGGSDCPEDTQGNCMQAVLASIFEVPLETAPDFSGQITNGKWFLILEVWLKERGLGLFCVDAKQGPPPGIHIMTTKSTTLAKREDGHVVVVQNGNPIHDPNPRAKAIGEADGYWVFVPLDPTVRR